MGGGDFRKNPVFPLNVGWAWVSGGWRREGGGAKAPEATPPDARPVAGARERARVGGGPPFFEGMAMLIVVNLTGDPGHPLSRVQKS